MDDEDSVVNRKESLVFVVLLDGSSSTVPGVSIVSEDFHWSKILLLFVTLDLLSEPSEQVSPLLTIKINDVNVITEEVSELIVWDLHWLSVSNVVGGGGVLSHLLKDLFSGLNLSIEGLGDVNLVWKGSINSVWVKSVDGQDFVPVRELDLEVSIFAVLWASLDLGVLWLVVLLDELSGV